MNVPFLRLGSEPCDRQASALIDALVRRTAREGGAPLDALVTHAVPAVAAADAIARYAPGQLHSASWLAAVERSRARATRLERAAALAGAALSGLAGRVAVAPPSLGSMWQHDVDVFVAAHDLDEAASALRDAGFLDLEPLLRRIGRLTPGVHRFGAHQDCEVLGSIELCTRLDDFGPPADAAVAGAVEHGGGLARLADVDAVRRRCLKVAAARRPSVRAAVELLAIVANDWPLPDERDVAAAFHRCAALERELVGAGILSARAGELGRRANLTWIKARARRAARRLVRRSRRSRFAIAFSGIDGAGKSTQVSRVTENLERLDVPAETVWLRIGYGDARVLQAAGRIGRRLLPAGSGDAMVARAAGAEADAHRTRRGILGWTWALLVTLNFIWLTRRSARRARGLTLVNDRALPDAVIGLEEGWGGVLRLRLHRRMLERFAARPNLVFYLRLRPELSLRRKQDIFAARVLERQARAYEELLGSAGGVVALDAEDPVEHLELDVLRRTCEG